MTEVEIAGRTWTLGEPLGSGGFGVVHVARSGSDEAAIKLIPKDESARRELLLADNLSGLANVLPIYGISEVSDFWALLMPRAQISLADQLKASGGPLEIEEVPSVLNDLSSALVALKKRGIVHRDIKPANILLWNGSWCLADFGIARYVRATTATDTWKYATTRAYMSPEQWREEEATSASDVYAFGVVCFEVLSGHLPFKGPNFREQHLHQDPPELVGVPPRLASLVDSNLYKSPKSRPSARMIQQALVAIFEATGPTASGLRALQEADRAAVRATGNAGRVQSQEQTAQQRRGQLLHTARRQIGTISQEVLDTIRTVTPTGKVKVDSSPAWSVQLNKGTLSFSEAQEIFRHPGFPTSYNPIEIPFDILMACSLTVQQESGSSDYSGRAHCLWFCDAEESGRHVWYEVAFSIPQADTVPLVGYSSNFLGDKERPKKLSSYAAFPGNEAVVKVFRESDPEYRLAWPFSSIQPHSMEDFIDRWAGWFAEASQGNLRAPGLVPVKGHQHPISKLDQDTVTESNRHERKYESLSHRMRRLLGLTSGDNEPTAAVGLNSEQQRPLTAQLPQIVITNRPMGAGVPEAGPPPGYEAYLRSPAGAMELQRQKDLAKIAEAKRRRNQGNTD